LNKNWKFPFKILKLTVRAPPWLHSRSNKFCYLMHLLKPNNFCMKHFFLKCLVFKIFYRSRTFRTHGIIFICKMKRIYIRNLISILFFFRYDNKCNSITVWFGNKILPSRNEYRIGKVNVIGATRNGRQCRSKNETADMS